MYHGDITSPLIGQLSQLLFATLCYCGFYQDINDYVLKMNNRGQAVQNNAALVGYNISFSCWLHCNYVMFLVLLLNHF